jgi:hypothetical protein
MRSMAFAMLVAFLAVPVRVAAAGPQEPLSPASWIDRSNDAISPTSSMRARARITTRSEYQPESVDVLDVVRARFGDTTRTLIEVEAPQAGQGTVYEIVARPGEPVERWAWLPELRRLRKIVGVGRTDSFLGTAFTYEDLGLVSPGERGTGRATWAVEDGRPVVEVESDPYHYYGRVVTHIDPETKLPTNVLFYDRAGQLFREEHFGGVRTIDGHPFPTEVRVRDRLTGDESTLTFESVEFDVDVPEKVLSQSVIRRKLAAWPAPAPQSAPEAGGRR